MLREFKLNLRRTRFDANAQPPLRSNEVLCDAHKGKASAVLDVLTKDDAHTIEITQTKLADAIRLVGRLFGNVGPSIDNLFVVAIDVFHPLKQVDTTGTRIVFNEVNR